MEALLIGLVALFLYALIASEFQEVAKIKGFRSAKYGWLAFLVPVAGWILVAALPDRGKVAERPRRRDAVDLDTMADIDDDLPDL